MLAPIHYSYLEMCRLNDCFKSKTHVFQRGGKGIQMELSKRGPRVVVVCFFNGDTHFYLHFIKTFTLESVHVFLRDVGEGWRKRERENV